MNQNLINDVSELTCLKRYFLDKLINTANYCISDYILEAKLKDEDLVSIDLGIGTLNIIITNNEIEYNFVPSNKLEKSIVETYQTEQCPMREVVSEALVNRMVSTYKEIF